MGGGLIVMRDSKRAHKSTHDIIRKGKCSSRMRWKMKEAGWRRGAGRDLNSYEEKNTVFKLMREKTSTASQKWIQL